jgi:hypothetical protein
MTQKEVIKLAKLEEKTDNIETTLGKIEAKLDRNYEVMLAKIEKVEKQFVTRSELKMTQWFIGIAISLVVVALSIVDKIRTH